MNAPVSETAVEPLLFSWAPPRRRQLALAAFLALSLVAHALCFYVFQIVYPPIVSLLPPPARISVITSSSEEGRTLLRWIDAEDPALAFTTQRPPETRLRPLPEVEHVPSYLAVEPALKEIPSEVSNLRIPDSQPPGAAPFGHRQTAPAIGATTTSVSFSKELEVFGAPTLPSLSFAASNNESPQTTHFRVAVNGIGRNALLLSSQFVRRSGPGQAGAPLSRALPVSQRSGQRGKKRSTPDLGDCDDRMG